MAKQCTPEFFQNAISSLSRELTQKELEKLHSQDIVNDFKQKKLEIEAQKNWDKFYHRNKDNFFKDRNWSSQDMQELCFDINFETPALVFLEAGCGCGNFLVPFASSFKNMKFQGFDFSKNAVQLLQQRIEHLQIKAETTVLDLTDTMTATPFSEEADLATLIFVLSAIHPEKHQQAIENLAKLIKVGGSVIIRDYGINDYAMIRFGRNCKLADRFYVRQDGTRAFYFKIEELIDLFEKCGFKSLRCEYLHRRTVNHQKAIDVPRVFVQGRFLRIQ